MQTEPGELLVLWTARLMVSCYIVRIVIDMQTRGSCALGRVNRWIWTVGCGLLLVHLVSAFHFLHHWSHASAYEHTAKRTAEVIGLNWGGGIWVNYAFTLFWIADVCRWWGRRMDLPDSRSWFRTVHRIFALMMINATAVFGPPYWKWVCAVVVAGLAGNWLFSRQSLKNRQKLHLADEDRKVYAEDSLSSEE